MFNVSNFLEMITANRRAWQHLWAEKVVEKVIETKPTIKPVGMIKPPKVVGPRYLVNTGFTNRKQRRTLRAKGLL